MHKNNSNGENLIVSGEHGVLPHGIISLRGTRDQIEEKEIQDILLPIYEGRMINQFDFSEKGWVSGSGRSADWENISWNHKVVKPQYLIPYDNVMSKSRRSFFTPGVVFMDIASATNARTMYASYKNRMPCGNSAPIFNNGSLVASLKLCSLLNSFSYDFAQRIRLGGLHLNLHYLEEVPICKYEVMIDQVAWLSARINIPDLMFAPEWIYISNTEEGNPQWKKLWALTAYERKRIRVILDAIIAELYGLEYDDFEWILKLDKNDLKGFWRVDKHLPTELQQTVLSLAAFCDLTEMGLEAFLNIEDPSGLPGCGWQIPEELTVNVNRDGIIEFDTAAGKTEKVRERFGPRFYDWQLEQSPEESWEECHIHVRNILGKEKYDRLIEQLENGEEPTDDSDLKVGEPGQEDLFDKDSQIRLF